MYVTAHARARLRERIPRDEADAFIRRLEATPGAPGVVAVVLARLGETRGEPDASNGDTVVAIVRDGEVTTAFYRRSGQKLTADALCVERIEAWA